MDGMEMLIYGHFQILIATAQHKIPARFGSSYVGTSPQFSSHPAFKKRNCFSPMFSKPPYIKLLYSSQIKKP